VSTKADVVIIGGGALGCAIAYYLARKKVSVVVLEKGEISQGASSRNTGAVHLSGKDPNVQALVQKSVAMFTDLSEELDADIEFRRKGSICLVQREEDLERRMDIMQRDQANGLDVSWLQPEEVVRIAPAFSTDVCGASWCPNDGQVNPLALTFAYARAAQRLGAEIRTHCTATGIKMQADRIVAVDTNQGQIATPVVVNAANDRVQQVLEMAGLAADLPPKRSFMMITEPMPHLLDAVIGLGTGDFTARQALDGKFHIGARGDYRFEMAGFDLRPTHRMIRQISQRVVDIMPILGQARILRAFGGLVAYPEDILPLLGPVAERPGFFLAAGFYGAITYSPAVGISIAECVVDGKSQLDLERFRFERLSKPDYQYTYNGDLRLTENTK
jgi:sarcosine oxidase subunit beta